MRLFLIGDTPLLERVRQAFNGWLDQGEWAHFKGWDSKDLLRELLEFQPDVVLMDFGLDPVLGPQIVAPRKAFISNAVVPGVAALHANSVGAAFYHISDPYVFPGTAAHASTDQTYPQELYGFTRLLGEHTVQALHPNAAIVRVGWLYGEDIPESPPMIAHDALVGIRSVAYVHNDLVGSPTYVGDAAALLAFRIIEGHVSHSHYKGVFHLAPKLVTDWYTLLADDYPVRGTEFKKKITKEWRRNTGLIPSDGWIIPAGGLERHACDLDRNTWDWTASIGDT